jgi:nitroreductase
VIEELFRTRRSVRRFKPEPLPEALVARLIEGAITAPSASNKQPWKFLVVQNRELIARMAEAVRAATQLVAQHIPGDSQPAFERYGDYFTRFEQAPLVLVPIFRPLTLLSNLTSPDLPAPARASIEQLEVDSGLIGTSLALGQLLLLAHELGLGASGMTGPLLARTELKALLEVPSSWDIVALVPLGYPDETPTPTERKAAAAVTRWFR